MSDNQEKGDLINALENWSKITVEDLVVHVFFQKSEGTVDLVESYLSELSTQDVTASNFEEVFDLSVRLRNFTVLLRDSLLSLVKHHQYNEDKKTTDLIYIPKLKSVITDVAQKVREDRSNKLKLEDFKHQNSPLLAILDQISEIKVQLKKIYRSHDKINEIRLNIESFKREFQVHFQKQIHAIEELEEHIHSINDHVIDLHPNGTKEKVQELVDELTLSFNKLELMQSMETMEVLSYAEKNNLLIPISIDNNYSLESKSFEIQAEMSKWFSANIYPHIIDLENRRNLAIERSLTTISKGRIKLSALLLENDDVYEVSKTKLKPMLSGLLNDYIKPLREEKADGVIKIQKHFDEELFASAIYDEDVLFLPNNGSVQINNISRDAQKRMATQIKKSKEAIYVWLRNSVAKYIELDRTPFNAFVSNKLLVKKDDERLTLFLKKGYLGKSFMVSRPKVMSAILNDHKHWHNGYSAAILIYGNTGSGKSAVLGMLPQLSLDEEVITVSPGEPYFTSNRAYDGSYNLKSVIENIAYQNIGTKITLAIDDLGLWHSKENHLFDNICELFELIKKYKGDIYFVVSANYFLKKRLSSFRNLDLYFSSVLKIGSVSNQDIKDALTLRIKALPELGLQEAQKEGVLRSIIRNSKGNLGLSMLEYCRFYDDEYLANLKSQSFTELILENATTLMYVSSFRQLKLSFVSKILNDVDYKEFIDKIDYLVGQKVLVYIKSSVIAINPFLVHSIENTLNKKA